MVTLVDHWFAKTGKITNGFYLVWSAGAQTIAMFINPLSSQKFQNMPHLLKISDRPRTTKTHFAVPWNPDEKRFFSEIQKFSFKNWQPKNSAYKIQHWFNYFLIIKLDFKIYKTHGRSIDGPWQMISGVNEFSDPWFTDQQNILWLCKAL